MNFKTVIIFSLLIVNTCKAEPEIPKVKLVPAAYLEKLDHVTAYESHAKIIFKVELPQFNPMFTKDELCAEISPEDLEACKSNPSIDSLFFDDYTDFFPTPNSTASSGRRTKRGVLLGAVAGAAAGAAVGYLAHTVITKVSNSLFGTEDDITKQLNLLRGALQEQDQRYFLMETHVKEFAEKMDNYERVMLDQVNKSEQAVNEWVRSYMAKLNYLLLVKINHDFLSRSIDQCSRKEFPIKLISPANFVKALNTLEQEQQKSGKHLAIRISDVSKYFKLPIFDCFFSKKYATVVANIPLVKQDSNWSVYKINHLKFAYLGQVCELYPQQSSYLATSNYRDVLITSHWLPYCSVDEHQICLIPQFQTDSTQSLDCVVGILRNKPVSELSKTCAFRCSSNKEVSISQINRNTIVVTNAEKIEIKCSNFTQTFNFTKVGAVEVNLICNCTTIIDNKIVVDPFYCLSPLEVTLQDSVYRTIPTLWSNLPNAFGNNEHTFIDHSNHTFNANWTADIPVLNLTSKPIYIPEAMKTSSNMLWTVWLLVLTILYVLNVIFIYCVFKFLILP